MKLTLKLKLTLDEVTFNVLREIGEYSGKFYNMVNYDFRNGNFMSFYDMYDCYKDHIRCKYLQAHTYENTLKQFSKDYKSYQGLLKNKGLINSDINGSLNILRKYDHYKNIPMLVKKVRDKGDQGYPIRLKIV